MSVIYFSLGVSLSPYYRRVCYSEVSARLDLIVYRENEEHT